MPAGSTSRLRPPTGHGTASGRSVYAAETNTTTVYQYSIASISAGAGKTKLSGIASTYSYDLGHPIAVIDTVPFIDPAAPTQEVLLAVKFTAEPAAYALYLLTPPSSVMLLTTLTADGGDVMSAVVGIGSEFVVQSGPQGRAQHWKRYTQATPGATPTLEAEGALPALGSRAASPNLFRFDLEPFVSDGAKLLASNRVGDWTTLDGTPIQESDAGFSLGLGQCSTADVGGGPDFIWEIKVLPTASTAGLGAVGALDAFQSDLSLHPPVATPRWPPLPVSLFP